ncbi:hypothetical protein [Promicromonospora sp. NPDC023805]|uniref:hypothetical protein n=1 Tax=Promicromonospora sp. NPDC023805 TaxID=3154696 RepID=UPI0033E5D35D
MEADRPRIVAGGGRFWRSRNHLTEAGTSVSQWDARWVDERMFLTADGEAGTKHGNLTIRVTPEGVMTVKVPGALVAELGRTHLSFAAPVSLSTHRGDERRDRIASNRAIRYDLHRDERGRWYVDASWGYGDVKVASLDVLRRQRTLGVDLNDGHLDCAVLDEHGNVVGTPVRFDVDLAGRSTSARDAQVRHSISRLIHLAEKNGCASVTIENLGFDDARATGRETMGRGRRGKTFRRKVAGIPTAKFRDRLASMAATVGLAVIAVDPAYTSRWAAQHWVKPLQTTDQTVDGHRAAAVVIGRRGLGHRARRKPVGPHARQRTSVGQSTGQPSRRARSLRPPTTYPPRALDAAGP